MVSENTAYSLTAAESSIICSFFNDLERRINLIKYAAIKSENIGVPVAVSRNHQDRLAILESRGRELSSRDELNYFHHRNEFEIEGIANESFVSDAGERSEDDDFCTGEVESERSGIEEDFLKLDLNRRHKLLKEPQPSTSSSAPELDGKTRYVRNVDYILDVVGRTKQQLEERNDFSVLKTEVDKAVEILDRDSNLKKDITRIKDRIKTLRKEIAEVKEEMDLEEQVKMGEISRLKDSLYLIKKDGEETRKLGDAYLTAKSTNQECKHRHKMEAEKEKIKKIEKQIDRDVHCLAVMDTWTEDFCQKIEEKITDKELYYIPCEWKVKLRRDEMIMEMRIEGKRRSIKSQEELIQSLNETIAERLEELAPWEEEKEMERQERLAHMRRYYSCRKIQRWWRAYMVKLKLYRKRRVRQKS